MKCTAKKTFSSVMLGNVDEGQVIEVDDGFATKMIDHGLLEPYDTKVITPAPKAPSGNGSPAGNTQSLPAAPASQGKTANKSGSGAKKGKTGASS
jgi:hypothetical protein